MEVAPQLVRPIGDGRFAGRGFSIAAKDTLYRCHDRLLDHKQELFGFLRQRWEDLFGLKFDVLLYDLTSTYFESDPPFKEGDKRAYGYSRDKRPDCVQVVIALVVTPEGFPLAYEVMPGNTADKTTLRGFLQKIETQYGKAERIWIMDRGIPTEEVLAEMRTADPPVYYLVGTPKGRLSKLEKDLLGLDWQSAREGVDVKLLPREDELYVLARSRERVGKERAMRRRQLKKLWARLAELQRMVPARDQLLLKLGAARQQYPLAWRLVHIDVTAEGALNYALRKDKLRQAMRREGRHLLRSNTLRPGPGTALVALHTLGRSRASFQKPQGRPRHPPHPSPTRSAHRSPHLHRLSCLLSARESAAETLALGTRSDATFTDRTTLRHSNARLRFPDHRRTHPGLQPLHDAKQNAEASP